MACDTSTVTLGGVAFDLDPNDYTPLGGERRGSHYQVIDEEAANQDRGLFQSDMVLNFSGIIASQTVAQNLWALYASPPGSTLVFSDHLGNVYNVLFMPGNSFTVKHIQGTQGSYEYQMGLQVTEVVTFFGGPSPF